MHGEDPLLLNNKRLLVESKLDALTGVQFYLSTISGYKAKDGTIRFWAGFFVAFSPSDDTVGKFLFNIIHDTGMVTMPAIGKKPLHEQLGLIVKDHKNACVQVKLFRYSSCVVKAHTVLPNTRKNS